MKTIEERAKEYSYKIHYGNSLLDNHLRGRERTIYLDAAKEQRKIDIEKACELIEKALQKLTTYKDKDNFTENEFKIITVSQVPNWLIKFRKEMEDKYVE